MSDAKSKRLPPDVDVNPAVVPLPEHTSPGGTWRIELRNHPIMYRGHAYLALVGPDKQIQSELHGLSRSKNTGKIVSLGFDGAHLVVHDEVKSPDWENKKVGTVAEGSYADIVAGRWARGKKAAADINEAAFDYKADDLFFEAGGGGGQIQNSNAVADTLGRAMGLDLDKPLRDAGSLRVFPGWGRNLLDAGYDRYVAPTEFPVKDAP